MTGADTIEENKKESDAFISNEPVELPTEPSRVSELPAEERPVEVSAVTSPVEIGSGDELSPSGPGSPKQKD